MEISKANQKISKVPLTVWMLGTVTLLLNVSSIMIFSLSPLYLTQVFGLAAISLGMLEGCVEFFSWTTRIISGVLSDYLRSRKWVLIFAGTLTVLARPIFAIAPTAIWVYTAKLLDRIANGFQATPREALVGDVSPREIKGTCYGLRHSLGVVGSLLGAVALMVLMRKTQNNYQLIFGIASIPPLLALGCLLFFVKDSLCQKEGKKREKGWFKAFFKKVLQLEKGFWAVICVTGIFMISNYSGAYRILQAQKIGFPIEDISLTMIAQNLGTMIAAFPVGRLSDRLDRRILLGVGFGLTILSNLFLGFDTTYLGMMIGSALWGMQMGITQSILSTMVADTTYKELRGTAFGIYYFVIACSLLLANLLMGWCSGRYNASTGFLVSGLIATVSISLIFLVLGYARKRKTA